MRLSPFSPYLPRYPGPHHVGTIDIELPLPKDLHRTFGNCTVKTLLVRLFYPTTATKGHRPKWTGPGHYTIQGYAKFLGIKEGLLSAASYLGLKWTEIPAITDAPLAAPPASATTAQWPCMLFSHGLGGTRNAYSQVTGSIASGGVVVMAIEHRDNSAAISVVREGDKEEVVEYVGIKDSSSESIAKRRAQMSQRSYETRLGLELFRAMNDPSSSQSTTTTSTASSLFDLSRHEDLFFGFRDRLDCGPGRLLIGGHSFGAATAVNCNKDSTTRLPSDAGNYHFGAEFRAAVLLDVWCEVLVDSASRPLTVPTLCVASQPFQQWSSNWRAVVKLLSPPSSSSSSSSPSPPSVTSGKEGGRRNVLCWIKESAHLSQSDFGILFPLPTKYAFKATIDPRRAMDLNVRAVREFLRSVVQVGDEPADEAIFNGGEDEVVVFDLAA